MDSLWLPLFGGAFIGLSASLLWLFLGRISGISGIVWQVVLSLGLNVKGSQNYHLWRYLFLLGLVIGAGLFHLVSQQPPPTLAASPGLLVLAGLLVGVGVKLGSGCTSGHGVCGVSRGSLRSIIATLVFMGTGIATVLLLK